MAVEVRYSGTPSMGTSPNTRSIVKGRGSTDSMCGQVARHPVKEGAWKW